MSAVSSGIAAITLSRVSHLPGVCYFQGTRKRSDFDEAKWNLYVTISFFVVALY